VCSSYQNREWCSRCARSLHPSAAVPCRGSLPVLTSGQSKSGSLSPWPYRNVINQRSTLRSFKDFSYYLLLTHGLCSSASTCPDASFSCSFRFQPHSGPRLPLSRLSTQQYAYDCSYVERAAMSSYARRRFADHKTSTECRCAAFRVTGFTEVCRVLLQLSLAGI